MSDLPSLNIALSVIEELQKENAELKARLYKAERIINIVKSELGVGWITYLEQTIARGLKND